ncbi:MAG: hypothetical protein H0U24_03275 [Thermoleophilaceae bacterium]|nr:hypothetical protein [Thermoleophilaceae bacterium]
MTRLPGSDTIRIPVRFRGPPASANGGYTCGLVAGTLGARAAEITLREPPALERDLSVKRHPEGVTVVDGQTIIAEGRPITVDLLVPEAPSLKRAREAADAGYERWAAEHPFPECVVCGPDRAAGDGLRIFPGPLGHGGLFACPWTPHETLADAAGTVRPECVWAALDCPTSAPSARQEAGPPAVLARLAVSLDAPVRAGEPHVLVSWELGGEGRKSSAGAALFDSRGRALARSRALWIQLKEG